MAQMRQDPRSQRIAVLEADVAKLRAELAESEGLRAAGQRSLVEFGLRLSQENEALRKELERLRQTKENIGPRMNGNKHG
jgi:hypothetical protein